MGRGRAITPAGRRTQRLVAAATEAERREIAVDEVLGEAAGLTRRGLIRVGAVAGAGMVLGSTARPAAARRGRPRIAIVGGGLAGLRCAHALWNDHHVKSTLYEANPDRLGGRCWSLRGFFDDGIVGEHGGAFIDADHTAVRRLAASFGLQEERVNGGALADGEEAYRLNGAPYPAREAAADWRDVGYPAVQRAYRQAPWPQRYNLHTKHGRRLDRMSVPEWLDTSGIGATSRLGRLLQATAVAEWGGDPGDQSALNLIYLLADTGRGSLDPLSGDDEQFHIAGGNDQLVSHMAAQLPAGAAKLGHRLVAVRRRSNGTIALSFDHDGATVDVVADRVVLALPFTTLRQVDLSRAGLSALKRKAIRQMPLGTNAKVHLQLNHKTWPALGYDGSAYGDHDGFCTAWDDTVPRGPKGHPAILLAFPGGRGGAAGLTGAAHGPAPSADVDRMLNGIEPVFPGTRAAFSGVAYEDRWAVDEHTLGAYSYQRPGQYTTIFGCASRAEGAMHFAGEHTSTEYQGLLNGAVTSGQRAAREIMKTI